MKTHQYRIHPAIGIARLGNHPTDYFFGPEAPGIAPEGPYKVDGKIKRQAVRFRIFRYTYDEDGLSSVQEVTANDDNVRINWSVHLVNKKAASPVFRPEQPVRLRNAHVQTDRRRLVIDSGTTAISKGMPEKTLEGAFMNTPVTLGHISTDDEGRMIALGGLGASGSVPKGSTLSHYANNDNWYDDVSDGPVTATIEIERGPHRGIHEADSAWLVVSPPSYAPGIRNVVTWYDRALQVAVEKDPHLMPSKLSFKDHILPILVRPVLMQWVDSHAASGHSNARPGGHFLDPALLKQLKSNSSSNEPARRRVFERIYNPNDPANFGDMPALNTGIDPENPFSPLLQGSAPTEHQYKILRRWAKGDFEADLHGTDLPAPPAYADIKAVDKPAALDKAALDDSIGLSFFPGIEAGYRLARADTYGAPFRIAPELEPGDLTAALAVPWQADFLACKDDQPHTWWPAARPNSIFREGSSNRIDWVPAWFNYRHMVENWHRLGFIVPEDGTERFVETERDQNLDLMS